MTGWTTAPIILARGPSGRRRHWWRPQWPQFFSPLCSGPSWARARELDRESTLPMCPRCARLVPDTPLFEEEP